MNNEITVTISGPKGAGKTLLLHTIGIALADKGLYAVLQEGDDIVNPKWTGIERLENRKVTIITEQL